MNKADFYYIQNLTKILEKGSWDENPRPRYKDGTLAYSKFITGVFEEYDISKGEFPITTLRNTAIKTGIREIFWIYQKQSNLLSDAHDLGIFWWDDWNIGNNSIGVRYGSTVKKYNLINKLLTGLKKDPFFRRHIINLYQYTDLEESAGLYPCAFESIWSVRKVDGEYFLDMTLIQRSNDYLTAGYINKIQYVALMMMVANHVGYKVGVFRHLIQNLHIYDRHMDMAKLLLQKEPLDLNPYITLESKKNFYDYKVEDFEIFNIKGIQKLPQELELAI
jgi:thymidylate synthase